MSQRLDHCTLLSHGYIRELQHLSHQIMPASIITLCFNFYYVSNPNSYEWKISDKSMINSMKNAIFGELFESPIFTMFGLRWGLRFYPNGMNKRKEGNAKLCICCMGLPPNIQCISYRRKFSFVEVNYFSDGTTNQFSKEHLAFGWKSGTVTTHQIQQHEQFTFKIEAALLSVFNKNNKDITDQYLQNDASLVRILKKDDVESQISKTSMDMIMSRMDEICTKLDTILQRMDHMELRMNQYDKKYVTNTETEEFKDWIMNQVKLPQYFELFIENGIDDLLTASLLTMEAIKKMGIDKIGHQMKILNQVIKLKQNENNI